MLCDFLQRASTRHLVHRTFTSSSKHLRLHPRRLALAALSSSLQLVVTRMSPSSRCQSLIHCHPFSSDFHALARMEHATVASTTPSSSQPRLAPSAPRKTTPSSRANVSTDNRRSTRFRPSQLFLLQHSNPFRHCVLSGAESRERKAACSVLTAHLRLLIIVASTALFGLIIAIFIVCQRNRK